MHSRANTEPPGVSLRQENAGSSEVFDKQKKCLDVTSELMEELQSHPKPNEVRELLAGLMVFNFKLEQFDKFLASLTLGASQPARERAASEGAERSSQPPVYPFANTSKLIACYSKVLSKLEELLTTFREQKRKHKLKRMFGSVNLRKQFDQTHALLQQHSRELLELHLKEIEAEKDRQAAQSKLAPIKVPPRPFPAKALHSSSNPTPPSDGPTQRLSNSAEIPRTNPPSKQKPTPRAQPKQGGTLILKDVPLAARIDIEKMFWGQFKSGFQVPLDEFERRFAKLLSLSALSGHDSKLLRHILDSSSTGYVSFPKYDEFVTGFGPLKLSLTNIKRLFSRSWWHGYLSGEETEYLLDGAAPGSFLGRMSISNPGSFALEVVNKDGSVKHFLVKSVTNQDGLEFGRGVYLPLKSDQCAAFPDLTSLVESDEYRKIFQSPIACDFILERFFHGVLDRDEAEQLLANEAVGTFLVRFSSSQKPHLAVSVVSDNKAITHRLFERKGGKYWNGPQSFNTLRETVASCEDLKQACPNTRADLYSIMAEVPRNEIPSATAPSAGVPINSSKVKPGAPKKGTITTSTNYGDLSDLDLTSASPAKSPLSRDNQYLNLSDIGGSDEPSGDRYREEDDIYALAGEGAAGNREEEIEDEEGLFSIMEALKAKQK